MTQDGVSAATTAAGRTSLAADRLPAASEGQRQWDAHFARKVDDWAALYEKQTVSAVVHKLRKAIALRWIDELALPAGEHILEMGCGAGLTAVDLARRGYRVAAVDRVTGMVERTRRQAAEARVGDRVSATLGDAHELNFPAGSFGLVLALGVIPFLDRPVQALAGVARVLKPGGYVVLNSDNRWRLNRVLDPWLSPLLDPARGAVGALLRRLRLRRGAPSSGLTTAVCSNTEFDAWLRSVGLEKRRGETFGFGPFTLFGRELVPNQTGVRAHHVLQRLADRRVPIVRSTGNQYIVLACKGPRDERVS